MLWYPKALKCQVYENGNLLDLTTCSDSALENLADAIFVHWKTPDNSFIWFDVEIYEKQYWFRPARNAIEIAAFKRDPYSATGKRQISITKLYIDKMVGKKFKIKPENTSIRKWSDNMEVAFVF